jgi:hypothetical protein
LTGCVVFGNLEDNHLIKRVIELITKARHRCTLAVLAVLVLSAPSVQCDAVIDSDGPMLTGEQSLVESIVFDGTFADANNIEIQIIRLGGGQYEYIGTVDRFLDLREIAPETIADLTATFERLGLPEPEQDWEKNKAGNWRLKKQIVDLEQRCPWTGRGDRRCALILAELLEDDFPGILDFERSLAALPATASVEHVRFSLRAAGHHRYIAQVEEIIESVHDDPGGSAADDWTAAELYNWADAFRLQNLDLDTQSALVFFFGAALNMHSLVALELSDAGSLSVAPIRQCWTDEHLAAHGFIRHPDEDVSLRPLASASETDLVTILEPCFSQ